MLLVDDDDLVRRSTMRLLEFLDVTVVAVASGEQAIAQVERDGPPDLVLLDLAMPGIGGVETARRLLAEHSTLAIVVVSGHLDDRLRRELLTLGVREAIAKPFDPDELSRVVDDYAG